MLTFLRNRKKPILGAIAGAVTWLGLKVGLDVDPDTAALISGGIFAFIVERAGPIFGDRAESPQIRDYR